MRATAGSSMPVLLFLAALVGLANPTSSGSQVSPYAGQHQRTIKALSHNEVRDYLNGAGMGFSKAAELNHYPGPLHVLEMIHELSLSAAQIEQTRKLLDSVKREARELGAALVEKERALDSLFASGNAEPTISDALVTDIANLRGRIRAAHLRAHIAQRNLLTPEQIQQYDKLRGYMDRRPHEHGQTH